MCQCGHDEDRHQGSGICFWFYNCGCTVYEPRDWEQEHTELQDTINNINFKLNLEQKNHKETARLLNNQKTETNKWKAKANERTKHGTD